MGESDDAKEYAQAFFDAVDNLNKMEVLIRLLSYHITVQFSKHLQTF